MAQEETYVWAVCVLFVWVSHSHRRNVNDNNTRVTHFIAATKRDTFFMFACACACTDADVVVPRTHQIGCLFFEPEILFTSYSQRAHILWINVVAHWPNSAWLKIFICICLFFIYSFRLASWIVHAHAMWKIVHARHMVSSLSYKHQERVTLASICNYIQSFADKRAHARHKLGICWRNAHTIQPEINKFTYCNFRMILLKIRIRNSKMIRNLSIQ